MKYIIAFTLSLLSIMGYSQNHNKYWFSIIDLSKIPVISEGKGYVVLDFRDKTVNDVFDKYTVRSFERSFPTSKTPFLRTIFEMEIEDYNLIVELTDKASNIFLNIEEMPEIQLLEFPNDFGTNGGELQEQEELNYIRAPEAWILSDGNSDINLGISESVNIDHEDLVGQSAILNGGSVSTYNGHGTRVALFAGAKTDNDTGIASIGFDSFIVSKSGGTNAVIQLAQAGVKVINISWGSCGLSSNSILIYQNAMNEAYEEGAVLVAAAGNGRHSCSSLGAEAYHYPAANNRVIAVTSVGHLYELNDPDPMHNNQKDKFELTGNYYPITTYNDSVDIAAPGWQVLTQVNGQVTGTYGYDNGTSFAAPIVTGTIGLMFDVNYCLKQEEVETILKLSSRKIDNLPVNQPYYGKIGSGVLDAYEAVKMAKDMADAFGTVEVKDRILYRPWFYKLETAPYEIKMTNNDVSQGSKLKFKARNNIEILSGDYYPSTGGYIDLSIDETLALDCPPPSGFSSRVSSTSDAKTEVEHSFDVMPTLVVDNVTVTGKKGSIDRLSQIKVYDFFGQEVFAVDKINSESVTVNLNRLIEGIYVLKVFNDRGENIHTQKIIKK